MYCSSNYYVVLGQLLREHQRGASPVCRGVELNCELSSVEGAVQTSKQYSVRRELIFQSIASS